MVLVTATFEGSTIRMGLESCALEHFYEPWVTSIDNIQVKMSHAYGGMPEATWGAVGISQKAFLDRDGVTFMWPPPMTIWLSVRFTNTTEADSVLLKEGYGHYSGMNQREVIYDFMEINDESDIDLLELTSDIQCTTGPITDYNGATVALPRAVGIVEHVEPLRLNDYTDTYNVVHPRYHQPYLMGLMGVDWHVYDDGVNIDLNVTTGVANSSGFWTFYLNYASVGKITVSGWGGTIPHPGYNTLAFLIWFLFDARGATLGAIEGGQRTTAINIGHYATEQKSLKRYVAELCASYGHMVRFKNNMIGFIPIEGQGFLPDTVLNDASILPGEYESDSGPTSMVITRWQRRWTYTKDGATYVQEATRDINANQSVFFQGNSVVVGARCLGGSGFLSHPTACYGGDMIRRGMSVWNATTRNRTKVWSVINDTMLFLDDDIFQSAGQQYQIGYKLPYGAEMEVPSFSIDGDVNQENVKWILSFLHTRRVSVTIPMSGITSVLNYGDRITATERRAFGKEITLNYAKVIGITFDFMNETITYECAGTLYKQDPQTAMGAPVFSVDSIINHHATDPIRLSIPSGGYSIADVWHGMFSDNPTLIYWNSVSVSEAYHAHGCDGVVVSSSGTDYTAFSSCKGAWFMNCTGTEIDRSSAGSDLTVSTGDTIERLNASLPSGFSGYYRHFTQSQGDYLYAADGGATDIYGSNQPITLFIRFRCASKDSTQGLISKYSISEQLQYALMVDSSNMSRGLLSSDGSSGASALSYGVTDIASDGGWHTMALVYNDTDIRIYADGLLDSNSVYNPKSYTSGIGNTTSIFTIGKYSAAAVNLNGDIYEAGVWNDALSASAIAAMHANGIKGDKGASE